MIYDNIVTIAAEKGISIKKLEAQAGIGNGTIGKWRNSDPQVETLMKVAKALSVSLEELVKGIKP